MMHVGLSILVPVLNVYPDPYVDLPKLMLI